MTVISPPLFQTVDGVYQGRHLGIPYRDLMSEGVMSATDLKVSQRGAGANMSVDVAAGVAWIAGDDATATQPLYRCYNDGTVNLAVTTAHGTNARIDIVVAEVRDSSFSGVSQDWRLRVIDGTPAGSPSAPATPSNCIKLAEVSVPALDTTISDAQITDTRTRAYVLPGFRPVCIATRSSTQTLTTGVGANLQWNAEDYDRLSWHSTSVNTDRITPTIAGLYEVSVCVSFDTSASGGRIIDIQKNGSTSVCQQRTHGGFSFTGMMLNAHTFVELNGSTDYVNVSCFQDSGGNLNVLANGASSPTRIIVRYDGPIA